MSIQNSTRKPKGLSCYYSGSGNTRLAGQYIQHHVKNAKLDLIPSPSAV